MKVMHLAFVAWRVGRQRLCTVLWSTWYTLLLRCHPAVKRFGSLRATGRMHWKLDPRAHVVIGERVRFNSGPAVNAVGGHRRCIIAVLKEATLIFGDDVGISNSTLVCAERIELESRVMIGGGCTLLDSDMHPLPGSVPGDAECAAVHHRPLRVGAGAFVGCGAMILKGVIVGAEAVIGAGTVVRQSVPARAVVVGNPAYVVKQR